MTGNFPKLGLTCAEIKGALINVAENNAQHKRDLN